MQKIFTSKIIFKIDTAVILVFILTIYTLSGCVHDPAPPVDPFINPQSDSGDTSVIIYNNPCDSDTIYFENDIYPILQSNCAFSGCHDNVTAQDGVILTDYNNIMNTADVQPTEPQESDLYERITRTDPDKIMPPPPNNALSQKQIQMIADWIKQGALNNGCYKCDTLNVTFSGSIFPLLQNKCQGCHSGSNPGGGINITSYSEIEIIALNSHLYGTVNHEVGYKPMPYGGKKLHECELIQIRKWIDDGAPNN